MVVANIGRGLDLHSVNGTCWYIEDYHNCKMSVSYPSKLAVMRAWRNGTIEWENVY